MEEEKARQDKMSGGSVPVAGTSPKKSAGAMEEDDLLAQAIAMSMGEQAANASGDVEMGEALNDEDEEMKRAIAMSLVWVIAMLEDLFLTPFLCIQGEGQSKKKEEDPAVLSNILSSLPGVDPNDPRLKKAMDKKDKK